MQHLEEEITEFTKTVWASVLDAGITSVTEVVQPAVMGSTMTAWVQFTGNRNGALVLCCGLDTVRIATGIMMEMDPSEAGDEELADVLGELANMIGGNLKALFPQPTVLGLPNVVEGKEYSMRLPGSRELCQLGFEWRGAPIVVALVECDGKEKS